MIELVDFVDEKWLGGIKNYKKRREIFFLKKGHTTIPPFRVDFTTLVVRQVPSADPTASCGWKSEVAIDFSY